MNSRRRISPLYGSSLPRPGAPENGSHLGSGRNSFDLFLRRESGGSWPIATKYHILGMAAY